MRYLADAFTEGLIDRLRQVRGLDEIVAHVRADGRLVTSALPPSPSRTKDNPTFARLKKMTTLQAYRDLMARDATRSHTSRDEPAVSVVRLPEIGDAELR